MDAEVWKNVDFDIVGLLGIFFPGVLVLKTQQIIKIKFHKFYNYTGLKIPKIQQIKFFKANILYIRGVNLMGFRGPHCMLAIVPRADRGEVDFQKKSHYLSWRSQSAKKKRSLPLQHLHTMALLQASSIRNRVLRHEVKFIKNFRIVSRAALKGSEGRAFDTPALHYVLY